MCRELSGGIVAWLEAGQADRALGLLLPRIRIDDGSKNPGRRPFMFS